MDMPRTHLLVQRQFHDYARNRRERAELELSSITSWREENFDRLHRVTTQFLLTGIVDLTVNSTTNGPNVFPQHGPGFSWIRYVKELARETRRPFVIVLEQGPYASACATVIIQKQVYTMPLAARFFLLEKRWRFGDTRRWNFMIPRDLAEMIPQWRADCASEPELRRALRLEYQPLL